MDNFTKKFHTLSLLAWGFIKWVIIAIVIGILVGLVGTGFNYGIDMATKAREDYSWLIFLLPIAGLLIVFSYRICGMSEDKGTNLVLMAVRSGERLSIKTMVLIFFSSIITHLCGGSAGREGAALQIGGSLSAQIGRILRLDDKDITIITMCGMSAGFAALFGTPITAAVFAMEVISVGIMHYSAMVPCIISAIIGSSLASILGVSAIRFTITELPPISIESLLQVAIIGILCAVVSILFCVTLRKTSQFFKKSFPSPMVRIFVGGIILIVLTLLVGTRDYNGIGTDVIAAAFTTNVKPEAFVLKTIFVALTLASGYKGGEIIPVFFVGATFGNLVGQIVGLSPSFSTGLGIIAIFCGVTNCPLASLILSVEIFGTEGLLYFGVITAVSYMLSGYEGLYSEQKILYSKLKPEFINQKAGE